MEFFEKKKVAYRSAEDEPGFSSKRAENVMLDDLQETLLSTQIVYPGHYLRTEVRTVRLPNGAEAKREIVIPPDAVGVLALDEHENVYLVQQYRTAIKQVTLEIPAGLLEVGEAIEETAKRECAEEIGFTPGQLRFLFSYYHSVGFSTGKISLFLATALTPSHGAHTDPQEFLNALTLPFSELYQKVISGEIIDSKTLLAVLWYKQQKQATGIL